MASFNDVELFYGEIDRVGDLSIRTRFFSLSYVPLVPRCSFVLLDRDNGTSFPLPRIVWRSALLAWVRTLAFACGVLALMSLSFANGDTQLVSALVLATSSGVLWRSYRRGDVPFERAARWAILAGKPPALVREIEAHYGRSIAEVDVAPGIEETKLIAG